MDTSPGPACQRQRHTVAGATSRPAPGTGRPESRRGRRATPRPRARPDRALRRQQRPRVMDAATDLLSAGAVASDMLGRALRVALGLHVTLLTGAVAATLLAPAVPAFAAGCGLGAAAVALGLATTTADPVTGVAGPVALAVVLAPAGWLAGLLATGTPVAVGAWPRLAGGLAVLPGVLAVGLAARGRTRRRLEATRTHVTFTARPAPRTRRLVRLAVGFLLLVSVAVGVGMPLVLGDRPSIAAYVWLPALLPVWVALLADDDGREYAVTDAGLRIEGGLHRWATFSGYEVDGAALRLHRGAWYRATLSLDRGDIEDPDAVLAALDRHVPR